MIKIEHIDYHLHSNNSFDSKDTIENICRNAINLGFTEVCFTEHLSVNPKDPSYNYLDYDKYTNEINKCREMFSEYLVIKKGLEIGEPHVRINELKEYLKDKEIDFIIGSVHNIGDLKLRKYIKGKSSNKAYDDYFEEVYKTARFGDIDVIGHLDLMKRYAFGYYGNSYNLNTFKACIIDILKIAIKRNIGIELNTSGLRCDAKEFFPTLEILRLYKDLGGEIITIGSDSHSYNMVGYSFSAAIEMLKELGYRYIFKYIKRKPLGVKIK